MHLAIRKQDVQVSVPRTPEACFKAAGALALIGALIWLASEVK